MIGAVTLMFHDGYGAAAVAIDATHVTIHAFEQGDGFVLLDRREAPPGVIQFARSPERVLRLGYHWDDGKLALLLFDPARNLGYAMYLHAPACSRWMEVPEDIDTMDLCGSASEWPDPGRDAIDASRAG